MMRFTSFFPVLAAGLLCCVNTAPAQQPDPLFDNLAEWTHHASYYGGAPPLRFAGHANVADPSCGTEPGCGTDAPHAGDCGCQSCRRLNFNLSSWGSLEYLLWWTRGRPVPALVTTSPLGTARAVAGELPAAGVLFGGNDIGEGIGAGGLLDVGAFLDDGNQLGVGTRFLGYTHDSSGFFASSTGDPILARPFFDVGLGGAPDASIVAFQNPALLDENAGNISVDANLAIYVAEPYLRMLLDYGPGYRIDMMAGYHMTRINDGVRIDSRTTIVDPGNILVGTSFDITDDFHATNEFHGGSFGLITEVSNGCWNFKALTKVSMGTMRQNVRIAGQTTTIPPVGAPTTIAGGLLAQPSNSGDFVRNRTTIVPEANFTVGYNFRENMTLTVGYSFTYWNRMVLAGDQINLNIDPTQGVPAPAFIFKETDFWAQGVNLGFTWEFN